MGFSKCVSRIAISGAILGIIQGIAWTIFSIFGMVVFFERWTPSIPSNGNVHNYFLKIALVEIIRDTGNQHFVIQIIYLLFSFVWTIISVFLLKHVVRKKFEKETLTSKVWCGWTLLISVFDLMVLGIYASSYRVSLELYNQNPDPTQEYSLTAYGILFSLAARGYVLWLINMAYAGILLHSTISSEKVLYRDPMEFVEVNTRYSNRPIGYVYPPNRFPKLPQPDYSPPTSRGSVMRNNSNTVIQNRPRY